MPVHPFIIDYILIFVCIMITVYLFYDFMKTIKIGGDSHEKRDNDKSK